MSNAPRSRSTRRGQPTDPGVFDLEAFARSARREPFRFYWANRTWELPNLNDLDAWTVLKAGAASDTEAARMILEMAFGSDEFAKFQKTPMPMAALDRLFTEYQAHAGIEPGESPASPTS